MRPSEFRKKWAKPVVVDADVAAKLGLTEAIIVSNIHYWCLEHEANDNKRNFQEGFYWNYIAFEDWKSKSLPFFSLSTIKRTVKRLTDAGIIITGNYNKLILDKTTWYRIDYDVLEKALSAEDSEESSDSVNLTPSIVSEWNDHSVNLTPTIPDTTSDTNLDIVVPTEVAPESSFVLERLVSKKSDLKLKPSQVIDIAEEMGINLKAGQSVSFAKLLRDARTMEDRHQMLKNWVITKTGMLARRDTETGEVTVRKSYQEQTVENILAKRDINNFRGLNTSSIPEDVANEVSLAQFKLFVSFAQIRFPDWKPIEADFKGFQYRILELGHNVFAGGARNVYGILEHSEDCQYWAGISPSQFLGSSKIVRNAYEDAKLNARKFPTLAEEKRHAVIESL